MTRRTGAFAGSAPAIAGASIAGAIVLSLLLPVATVHELMREGGVVENATVVLYVLAIGAVWAARGALFGNAAALASTIVLLGCIAREISLRRLLIDRWSLDSSCCFIGALPLDLSLLPVLLVACAAGWLVLRYGTFALKGLWQRKPVATTLATFVCSVVFSQLMDRLPRLAGGFGYLLSPRSRLVALSVEEMLELALPVLVIVAAVQAGVRWRTKSNA